MTETQAKKLLELLERIAVALERLPVAQVFSAYPVYQPTPPSQCVHMRGTETTGGASCTKCGAWLGPNL